MTAASTRASSDVRFCCDNDRYDGSNRWQSVADITNLPAGVTPNSQRIPGRRNLYNVDWSRLRLIRNTVGGSVPDDFEVVIRFLWPMR